MKRFNKIISSVILVCFLFNTALSDLALSQTIVSRPESDNLAPASIFGNLQSIENMDIRKIRGVSFLHLFKLLKNMPAGLSPQNFLTDLRKSLELETKNDAIPVQPNMKIFLNETMHLTGSFYYTRCRVADARSFGPAGAMRTYYVVFSARRTEGAYYPFEIYPEKEFEEAKAAIIGTGGIVARPANKPSPDIADNGSATKQWPKVLPLHVDNADQVKSVFKLDDLKIKDARDRFSNDMDSGLSGQTSSLAMLSSYAGSPTGKEKGIYYALDVGGSNLRVMQVKLNGDGTYTILNMEEYRDQEGRKGIPVAAMTKDADALFDFVAKFTSYFLNKTEVKQADPGISRPIFGFTWSFPIEQTAVNSGKHIRWTKKPWSATGVAGNDVVKLLSNAFKKQGLHGANIAALCNDTVSVLAHARYAQGTKLVPYECLLGVVLGTGTNACVELVLKSWLERFGPKTHAGDIMVNIEWGNFDKLFINSYDWAVDQDSGELKGIHYLEKMTAGSWLSEVARFTLNEMIKQGLIFRGKSSSVLLTKDGLDPSLFSAIVNEPTDGDLPGTKAALEKIGIKDPSPAECRIVKDLFDAMLKRAGRVIAIAIAASIEKADPLVSKDYTIALDGSCYKYNNDYRRHIEEALGVLLGKERAGRIHLVITMDASSVGAAITAAAVTTAKAATEAVSGYAEITDATYLKAGDRLVLKEDAYGRFYFGGETALVLWNETSNYVSFIPLNNNGQPCGKPVFTDKTALKSNCLYRPDTFAPVTFLPPETRSGYAEITGNTTLEVGDTLVLKDGLPEGFYDPNAAFLQIVSIGGEIDLIPLNADRQPCGKEFITDRNALELRYLHKHDTFAPRGKPSPDVADNGQPVAGDPNVEGFREKLAEYDKWKSALDKLLAEQATGKGDIAKILAAKNQIMYRLEKLRMDSHAIRPASMADFRKGDIVCNLATKELIRYDAAGKPFDESALLKNCIILRPLRIWPGTRYMRDELVKILQTERNMNAREEALRRLRHMVNAGMLPAPVDTEDAFQHCHSTYSHSPGDLDDPEHMLRPGNTPAYIVWKGYLLGLQVTGIVDHDTVDGNKEFLECARIVGLRNPTTGYEQRTIAEGTPFEFMQTNSPGNIGETYVAFHGVSIDSNDGQKRVVAAKIERFKKNAAFINDHSIIPGKKLDYDKHIKPLTEANNPTEKHVSEAIARLIYSSFAAEIGRGEWDAVVSCVNRLIAECCKEAGDTRDLSVRGQETELLKDLTKFTFLIRNRVVTILKKKIQPTREEVVSAKSLYEYAHSRNELVYYCYLGGEKPCEAENRTVLTLAEKRNFIEHMKGTLDKGILDWWLSLENATMLHLWFAYQKSIGADGVAFMPNRNSPEEIDMVIRIARESGFERIANGMDVNTPDMPFTYFGYSNRPDFVRESLAIVAHENKMRASQDKPSPDIADNGASYGTDKTDELILANVTLSDEVLEKASKACMGKNLAAAYLFSTFDKDIGSFGTQIPAGADTTTPHNRVRMSCQGITIEMTAEQFFVFLKEARNRKPLQVIHLMRQYTGFFRGDSLIDRHFAEIFDAMSLDAGDGWSIVSQNELVVLLFDGRFGIGITESSVLDKMLSLTEFGAPRLHELISGIAQQKPSPDIADNGWSIYEYEWIKNIRTEAPEHVKEIEDVMRRAVFSLNPKLIELERRYRFFEAFSFWPRTVKEHGGWKAMAPQLLALNVATQYAEVASYLALYDRLVRDGYLKAGDVQRIMQLDSKAWGSSGFLTHVFPRLSLAFGVLSSENNARAFNAHTSRAYNLDPEKFHTSIIPHLTDLNNDKKLQEAVARDGKFNAVFIQNPEYYYLNSGDWPKILSQIASLLSENGKVFFIIDKYDTTNNALRNFLKQHGAEVIDDGRIPSQMPRFYPTQIFILDASKIAAIANAQAQPEQKPSPDIADNGAVAGEERINSIAYANSVIALFDMGKAGVEIVRKMALESRNDAVKAMALVSLYQNKAVDFSAILSMYETTKDDAAKALLLLPITVHGRPVDIPTLDRLLGSSDSFARSVALMAAWIFQIKDSPEISRISRMDEDDIVRAMLYTGLGDKDRLWNIYKTTSNIAARSIAISNLCKLGAFDKFAAESKLRAIIALTSQVTKPSPDIADNGKSSQSALQQRRLAMAEIVKRLAGSAFTAEQQFNIVWDTIKGYVPELALKMEALRPLIGKNNGDIVKAILGIANIVDMDKDLVYLAFFRPDGTDTIVRNIRATKPVTVPASSLITTVLIMRNDVADVIKSGEINLLLAIRAPRTTSPGYSIFAPSFTVRDNIGSENQPAAGEKDWSESLSTLVAMGGNWEVSLYADRDKNGLPVVSVMIGPAQPNNKPSPDVADSGATPLSKAESKLRKAGYSILSGARKTEALKFYAKMQSLNPADILNRSSEYVAYESGNVFVSPVESVLKDAHIKTAPANKPSPDIADNGTAEKPFSLKDMLKEIEGSCGSRIAIRLKNDFDYAGISSMAKLLSKTPQDLRRLRHYGIGKKLLLVIRETLARHDKVLKGDTLPMPKPSPDIADDGSVTVTVPDEVSVVDMGGARQVLLSILPKGGTTLEEKTRDVFSAVDKWLEANGMDRNSIVTQNFFLKEPADKKELAEIIGRRYERGPPPSTGFITQAPANGEAFAVEITAIGGKGVEVKRIDGNTTVVKENGTRWVYVNGIEPSEGIADTYEQALESFRKMRSSVERAGLKFEDVVRTWLYQKSIVAQEDGKDRYDKLNRARNKVFKEEGPDNGPIQFGQRHFRNYTPSNILPPASTGIGMSEKAAPFVMACLAMSSENPVAEIVPIENPAQDSTWKYKLAPGRDKPLFSRGMEVSTNRRLILISGTASVEGSEIIHPGDLEKQTYKTLENVGRVLGQAGATFKDIPQVRIYVKPDKSGSEEANKANYEKVKAIVDKVLPGVAKIYLMADVCRDGWLVEIEALAFLPAKPIPLSVDLSNIKSGLPRAEAIVKFFNTLKFAGEISTSPVSNGLMITSNAIKGEGVKDTYTFLQGKGYSVALSYAPSRGPEAEFTMTVSRNKALGGAKFVSFSMADVHEIRFDKAAQTVWLTLDSNTQAIITAPDTGQERMPIQHAVRDDIVNGAPVKIELLNAEKQIDKVIPAAREACAQVTPPARRYTLIVDNNVYKNGELNKDIDGYDITGAHMGARDRFDLKTANTADLNNVLEKIVDPANTIVQVSGELTDKELAELQARKPGIRIIRMNTTGFATNTELDETARRNARFDLYAMMLLARRVTRDDIEANNSIYRALSFMIETRVRSGEIAAATDYIEALAKSDPESLVRIIKTNLSYVPAEKWRTPKYQEVAATLISA